MPYVLKIVKVWEIFDCSGLLTRISDGAPNPGILADSEYKANDFTAKDIRMIRSEAKAKTEDLYPQSSLDPGYAALCPTSWCWLRLIKLEIINNYLPA